ncbi:MAG TPA: hypothetical protein VEC11_09500 [Allosphingosinicella sp.]|nr:hypothetical protein [Allosphingosinicella sp.]
MASKPSKSLFRGGRNALDLPVAGLSALAAAFAAFAVPQDLLSRAVVATGLPTILSAAQPPLGLTARVGLAVVGAVLVFGLVFLLLRLLDRSGLNGDAETGEDAQPRVRRRDGHPDAPPPRPISAARDLGEPAPPRAPRAATPLWLDEAEPVGAPALEPEPEPAWQPEPEPLPEPVAEAWPEPEPEPEPEVVAGSEPAPEPEPVTPPVLVPQPAAAAEMPSSIADLMERLEQGLAKRRAPAPAAPASPPQVFPEQAEAQAPQVFPETPEAPAAQPSAEMPAAPPQVFPEAPEAEDRLQSAIASLRRLAARAS